MLELTFNSTVLKKNNKKYLAKKNNFLAQCNLMDSDDMSFFFLLYYNIFLEVGSPSNGFNCNCC